MLIPGRRLFFSLAVVFCFMIEAAHAATTLNLLRQFAPSEMGSVGVEFVNPTLTAAVATFYWRTSDGVLMLTTVRTIPPKGQMSVGLNSLFPEAIVAGWLSAEIDVDQVSGFWLMGDFAASADGAPLINTTAGYWYPAFTFFSRTTEISVANVGPGTVTGTLYLFNASGATVTTKPFTVPALGIFQQPVASLFPAQANSCDSSGCCIGVVSSVQTAKLIGTSVTPNPGKDNIVTNSALPSSTRFVFPQVVDGPIGGAVYSTPLVLTNYQTTSQTVTLTLH